MSYLMKITVDYNDNVILKLGKYTVKFSKKHISVTNEDQNLEYFYDNEHSLELCEKILLWKGLSQYEQEKTLNDYVGINTQLEKLVAEIKFTSANHYINFN